ncbi:DUF4283 domain-containing protein [Artemisia annua]|uniref:DUF4283 domain-containing protein n=1 Tax=Artemisia annua TaxID=35608 RepID=A0A2U1N1H0_ARTAN|nr:DUF4283 domain-containing protein [Artemisia annua]
MGNASQNRNVKGSEEIRVSKLGENEISKGKVGVNDGKDNCDAELCNSGGNNGMGTEKSDKLNVSGKSYAAAVNGEELNGSKVNTESSKGNGETISGNGVEIVEVENTGNNVENSTNGAMENPAQASTSVSEPVTSGSDNQIADVVMDKTNNEANNTHSSYAQKLLENTKENGNQLFFVPTVVNEKGSGRLGYARVLIEVDASKEYADKVEINYVDVQLKVKKTKWVRVEYSWKPDRCSQCNVFGHSSSQCKKKQKDVAEVNGGNKQKNSDTGNEDGFNEVKSRKFRGDNHGSGNDAQGYKQANWKVNYSEKYVYKPKENGNKVNSNEKNKNKEKSQGQVSQDKSNGLGQNGEKQQMNPSVSESPPSLEKVWKVSSENLKELKKSANKYSVLSEIDDQGEKMENGNKVVSDEEDVYDSGNKATNCLIANEILECDSGQLGKNH